VSSSRRSFPEAEVADALGSPPRAWHEIVGGYTRNARRWRVELADGRTAFVKLALDELAARWLRDEHRVYAALEAPYLPAFLGWHDGEIALLALEDLTEARWPPPWREGDIAAALAVLEAIHATPPPASLERLEDRLDQLQGWPLVAADPDPFLATGICAPEWLEEALPALLQSEASCRFDGDDFLHFDFRSDNICFDGARIVVLDWNWACLGNGVVDLAAWLPSLRVEGGPEPWAILPASGGAAAFVAGFFAARAGLPPPPTAAADVRELQRRQGEVALEWAARELALPRLTT
jgi:aminoglycoside phosphotransferase (APT) family kinase protein